MQPSDGLSNRFGTCKRSMSLERLGDFMFMSVLPTKAECVVCFQLL